MTEILLIRHGETAWNAERRLQGHLDVPLNEEGVRQAASLGRALAGETFDAIYTSDLSRARQTAEPIAASLGMQLEIEPGLRERCYGAFEGLLYDEIESRYPDAYQAWKARDIDARFPQGERVAETLREFSHRAVNTVTRILEAKRYRRVVLVSHGGVLECVYRAAQGMGFERARDFDIFNASINRFTWNGNTLKLQQWGDVTHLTLPEYEPTPVLDEADR